MDQPFVLCGTINDRLHGGVSITKEERGIINHRSFLRLHNIRQLGNLYLVFPSATHTRFEHSIGVMDLADRLFLGAKLESKKSADSLAPLDTAGPGVGVRLYELDSKVEEQLRRTLRICALAHDLGHGPFSHNFEPFTPKVEEIAKLLEDPRLAVLLPYREAVLAADKHGRVKHEAISVILFTMLWLDNCPGDSEMPAALASVLLGAKPEGAAPELKPWIPFIRDIVSSAPIDADRMDYLERDSRGVGTSYGLFDHSRIFKSVVCAKSIDDDSFRLGWRENGLATIDHFVHARYQMFRQIYVHKTYRAMELMLDEIGREVDTNNLSLVDTSSVDALVNSYERLTDDHFVSLISGNTPSDLQKNAKVMKLGRAFKNRQLWKRVVECDLRDDVEHIREELKKNHPEAILIADSRPLNAMKDMKKATYLMRKTANDRYVYAGAEAWLEASVILKALTTTPESATRIYLAQTGESDLLQQLRHEATAIILRKR